MYTARDSLDSRPSLRPSRPHVPQSRQHRRLTHNADQGSGGERRLRPEASTLLRTQAPPLVGRLRARSPRAHPP